MTNQVEIIGDEVVREIEARYPQAARAIDDGTPPEVAAILVHIPALCATVKVLRAKLDRIKSAVAWHRDDVGPDVPVLQERYDKLIAQRDDLQSRLSEVERERNELREELESGECLIRANGDCVAT